MTERYDTIIVGQGLAGTTLAWKLMAAGQRVLVVDGESGTGASAVAAGLMTPVTGKRLVCSPAFELEWAVAVGFYQEIERLLEVGLLTVDPIIRVFDREEDREVYLSRSDRPGSVTAERWEGPLESGGATKVGVRISPAGRLNVELYLKKSRERFENSKSYRSVQLVFDGDVRMAEGDYQLVKQGVQGSSMVLCQGAVLNEWFPKVPNNPAKGEIWKVKLAKAEIKQVVHRSIWVAPDEVRTDESSGHGVGGGNYTVGATYEWRDFDLSPSEKGASELGGKLGNLFTEKPTVEKTLVGIRPTMKDREPVLGQHKDFPGLWVFNGLGSKGTLKSPMLADRMVKAMLGGEKIPDRQSYQRLLPSAGRSRVPLTKVAQHKISEVLQPGDLSVDATVGRGFDTAFLSRKVGPDGGVLGFDVQKEALEATSRRLASMGADNVELYHQGHESAADVLGDRSIQVAMFNLGFLPRSDKLVMTKESTTLAAVQAMNDRLRVGGRMTLLCYRGHEGGPEEYQAVGDWLDQQETMTVERVESGVANTSAPVLFVATKVTV